MAGPFFTDRVMARITEAFVKRLKTDPETPLSPRTINDILKTDLLVERQIKSFKAYCPKLPGIIDTACKTQLGKLAPQLGALGRLLHRRENGEIIEPLLHPKTTKPRGSYNKKSTDATEPPPAVPTITNGVVTGEHTPPPEGSSRTRKVWTSDVRDLLHEAVMERWAKAPEDGLTTHLFTKAMHECVPKEHWRGLTGKAAIGESWDRAAREVRKIVKRGVNPPEPEVEHVPVEIRVPVDVEQLLEEMPLEKLIGVVARRGSALFLGRIHSITPSLHHSTKPPPSYPPPVAPTAPYAPIDAAEIEKEMPHIQVIGFRPFDDKRMRDRFKFVPVFLHPSIDPSTPVNATLLAKDALYFVNAHDAPTPWREMVQKKSTPDTRATFTDATRVLDHISRIGTAWGVKHSVLFADWKKTRPQ